MPSSISNSKHPRAWQALALAALLTLVLAWMRSDSPYATAPSWYWRMKLHWSHSAGIVLAGDSRVYRGLDPSRFEATLGLRTLNFGFSAAALDDVYLDAIERVIDPGVSRPVIVLGVTPWSLTPRASAANGYLDALAEDRRAALPAAWEQHTHRLARALRPFALGLQGPAPAARATESEYVQDFRLDGWVASDQLKHQPEAGLRAANSDHNHGNRIDRATLDRLTQRITRWRARGWIVLACEPPALPAATRLAHELSGWLEQAVPSRLRAAGAHWIEVDPAHYVSYDGTHLTADSARQLSTDLAAALAQLAPR